jgi:hypothetical protein
VWAEDTNDLRLPTIRHQNDGLFAVTRELGMRKDAPFVFLCECGDGFCDDHVKLTLGEYSTHRREHRSILCLGHLAPRAA